MIRQSRHFFTPNIAKDLGWAIDWLYKNTFLNSFLERFFKARFQATEKGVFGSSSDKLFNLGRSNLDLINLDKEIDNYLDTLKDSGSDKNKILSRLKELQEKRKKLLFLKSEFNLRESRKED